MNNKDYINSKIECPVCSRAFAKNYLLVHLTKQHTNIFGTKDWIGSKYEANFEKIKKEHKAKWSSSISSPRADPEE